MITTTVSTLRGRHILGFLRFNFSGPPWNPAQVHSHGYGRYMEVEDGSYGARRDPGAWKMPRRDFHAPFLSITELLFLKFENGKKR